MWIVATAILLIALCVLAIMRHRRQQATVFLQAEKAKFQDDWTVGDIIGEYGTILTEHEPIPTTIYDESVLPFPKHRIREALIDEIAKQSNDAKTGELAWGLMLLAQFQPGIGDIPVKFFDFGIIEQMKKDGLSPVERARAIARQSAASADRYLDLKQIVDEEVAGYKTLIETAELQRLKAGS